MKPLEGVTVLDLSMLLPGPFCSMHLVNLGARVIKIENPRIGDGSRYMGGKLANGQTGIFEQLNAGKESVTVNIKRPAGRQLLLDLALKADVVIEGYRPGTLDKLGIGYNDLKAINPKLIFCAISGYGMRGTLQDHAGHDANFVALAGILNQNRRGSLMPALFPVQIGDILGGSLTALSSILAALFARERTGLGCSIDTSMADATLSLQALSVGELAATGEEPQPGNGLLTGELANYDCYEVAQGRHIMVAALEERFFENFLRQLDHQELIDAWSAKKYSHDEYKALLQQYLKNKTLSDLKEIFENPDCCVSPVLTLNEALNHEHFKQSGMVRDWNGVKLLGSPYFFNNQAFQPGKAPLHGEHTDQVLQELLQMKDQDIAKLRESRAI